MKNYSNIRNLHSRISARIMRALIIKPNLAKIDFKVIGLLFLIAWGMAFGVRTAICQRDVSAVAKTVGYDFVPFLVESSIMYSYVNEVAAGRGIPEYDSGLAKMENVRVVEQMPIGLEPFLGWGLRLKNMITGAQPDALNDAAFVRFQARLWLSLTGGFVLLWLLALRVSPSWALFGALIYAISPAAVARGTGQDLLCEVFALPFLTAALAFAAWQLRHPSRGGLITFALTAFCAVAFWDISQFVFALWALWELIRSFFDERPRPERALLFLTLWGALALAAILVPYHRAHGLILSPMFTVILPAVCLLNLRLALKNRRIMALFATLLLGVIWFAVAHNSAFSGNYEHFSELVWAKLRFMNVKPEDPAKLGFYARVLWTPALHSAGMRQIIYNFPGAFWAILFLGGVALFNRDMRHKISHSAVALPLTMTLVFFVIFIFMFRFHVLTAIFMSVSVAVLFSLWFQALKKRKFLQVLLLIGALVTIFAEADMLIRLKRAYPGSIMKETAEMLRFLRNSKVEKQVFLASMEISPLLKAYANTAIVVQPKFEFPEVRQIFQDYTMALFSSNQDALNRFCEEHHVEFLLYVRGNATAPLHIYSYRYMSGVKELSVNSPAYLMDQKPRSLNNFYEITFPDEYADAARAFRLFHFISAENQRQADITVELATEAFHKRNMALAQKLARAAYLLNPNSERAYILNYQVFDKIPMATIEDFKELNRGSK